MTHVQHDPIHQLATEWLIRLQDPDLSLEESLEWQRWVSADPRHQEAFSRVEAVWAQPWELMRQPKRSQPWMQVPRFAVAASLVVLAAAAIAFGVLLEPRARVDTVRTAVGENKTLTFADGSRATLGGDTELEAAFDAHTRRLELTRGEAYFEVAKDAQRPFIVHAGEATVTAVGTGFNVRRASDRVVVAVVEGRVIVEPSPSPKLIAWLSKPAPKRQSTPLAEGGEAVVKADGIAATSRMADVTMATAWQSGRLSFRQEPLRYVLEDVNRYTPKPIVIRDESIGDIRITGTVIADSVAGWVDGLESAFGLSAKEEDGRIVLEKK